MSTIKEMVRNQSTNDSHYNLGILSQHPTGSWVLSLPPDLKVYQGELEDLLGRVFTSSRFFPENFALAQQMSLNWCMSKCREVGISFDESFIEQQKTEPSQQ